MSLLVDFEITQLCQFADTAMIAPFSPISQTVCKPGFKGPSWGLSSTGYDIRLSDKWLIPHPDMPKDIVHATCVPDQEDLKTIEPAFAYQEVVNPRFLLKPKEFVLAVTIERFKMPKNVMGLCTGKSTLARQGLIVFVTPLEVNWEGYLTLELFNAGSHAIDLTAGIGICQLNFFRTNETPHKNYLSRSGKYQNQPNKPVAARVV